MAPAPPTQRSSWLVIDDTSLLLIIAVITLLLLTALLTRWNNQPAIHPLILGRQADTSQVRSTGQSPVYRNANSPHGFDLATKPRREAADVKALLSHGAKGDERSAVRTLYGHRVTNEQVLQRSRKFGMGLLNILSSTQSAALAVCVDSDHLEALEATLSASLLSDSSSGKVPFSTLVVPPLRLPRGQPQTFPTPQGPTEGGGQVRLAAVYTTPKAIVKAVGMSIVDSDTLFVLATQSDIAEAEKALSAAGPSTKPKLMTFAEVVDKGSDVAHPEHTPSKASSHAIHSSFWLGDSWVPVTNLSLCAGVTANLSFYPADGIPSSTDHMWVEQSPYASDNPPSLHLGATATPAGLALALTALYTGASLSVGPLTSSLNDANPTTSDSLQAGRPSLVYASPLGASSLGLALTTLSKRSPLASLCYNGQLRSLRHGSVNSRNSSLWDSLLFRSVRRSSGTSEIRGVTIVGRGWVVGQGLLDVLRAHLGCPVSNSFLPATALRPLIDAGDGNTQAGRRETQTNGSPSAVWTTAPICQSHVLDVQSFRANNGISEMPAHVGPPSVAVEIKVVEQPSPDQEQEPRGWDRFLGKDDCPGVVCVRGPILTSQDNDYIGAGAPGPDSNPSQWYTTDQPGAFRSNGTLLLLPPTLKHEKARPTADGDHGGMVATPTLSAERPAQRAAKETGIGAEQRDRKDD
ncbi:unnamed protein product [Parajaminaea phylloscopi]